MIYIFADTLVVWSGLQNSITGAFINDASIVAVLHSQPPYTLELDYEAGTDGDYVGVIPATVTEHLKAGTEYLLEITATHPVGTDYRRETHLAQYRGFSQ